MKTFGEGLKALRERAGLTQAALASKTGLSLGIVRDYEQGRKEPALRSAFKLADALGVSVDAFQDYLDMPGEATPAEPAKRSQPGKKKRKTGGG